jgi:hypothetical protein
MSSIICRPGMHLCIGLSPLDQVLDVNFVCLLSISNLASIAL